MWRDLCMAHWRADGARLEPLLPRGLTLDRFEGDAWLSIVPFRMTGIHGRGLPVLPGFDPVSEINLRTYVRAGNLRGIYFFSLDASRPVVVRMARLTTGLPYFDARIDLRAGADAIAYRSERTQRRAKPARFSARYRRAAEGAAARPGSLEEFLHERYHFFNTYGSRLVSCEVTHRPWQLAATEIEIEENTMGEQIGHPLTGAPDCVYYAEEMHARSYALRAVAISPG
jgi:uncharacterized protein YqjF (DUF2071 family)